MRNINLLLLAAGLIFIGSGEAKKVAIKAVSIIYGKRGLDNNNAGNIVHSDIKWLGMSPVQKDSTFVSFIAPEYGIRAMYKNLIAYRNKGLLTVKDIISRWSKTDQNAYIKYVSNSLGVSPTTKLSLSQYPDLIAAIVKFENGINPYTKETILKGVQLA